MQKKKKGFTLVELSIVLVIIGLLIGGILAAQSMISTAKLEGAIKTIQQYDIAATNFETKYNGQVPGDSIAFGCVNIYSNICGDGQIYSDTFLYSAGNGINLNESFNFWANLNQAGLLSQQFTGYPTGGFPSSTFPGDFTGYAPTLNYGTKSFLNAVTINIDSLHRNPNFGNAWVIEANVASNSGLSASLTNSEALALDTKIDDGVGSTGNVQTLSAYAGILLNVYYGYAYGNCYNYTNLSDPTPNCALAIKAQW